MKNLTGPGRCLAPTRLWGQARAWPRLGMLAAEAGLLTWVLAKRIVISPSLMGLALFLAVMGCFVQWRLPRMDTAAVALVVYLPFSKQLSQDLGAFPTAMQAIWGVLGIIVLHDILTLIKRKSEARMSKFETNPNVSKKKNANVSNIGHSDLQFVSDFGFRNLDLIERYRLGLKGPILMPFLILLAWGLLSVFRAAHTGDISLGGALSQFLEIWMAPFLLYFIFFRSLTSSEARILVAAGILVAAIGVSLVTLYESFNLGNVHDLEDARVGGIANDPNILAAYLNLCAFLPLGILLTYFKDRRAWLALIPFFLILRALLTTYSRGGYLAFAVGFYALAFLKKKILVIPLLVASFALLSNPAVLPESMRVRLAQTFEATPVSSSSDVKLDRSNQDRIEVWKGALQMIKEHPVFGVGFGLFKIRIPQYWASRMPFEPHNTYLLIASEMGLPALGIFLWMLGGVLCQGYVGARDDMRPMDQAIALGIMGGLVSFLVSYLFVIRLDSLEVAGTFWIFIAILMGLAMSRKSQREVLRPS